MAKNLKGAAAASADIFDTITRGNVQDAEAVQYTQNAQNAKDVNKEGIELAGIAHDGIHADQAVFRAEFIKDHFHQLDLAEGAEVAGVDGVHLEVQ